jgi:hypothetical protein
MQQRAIALDETKSRTWSPEGYDGEVHYGQVLGALAPAAFILTAATVLMLVLL